MKMKEQMDHIAEDLILHHGFVPEAEAEEELPEEADGRRTYLVPLLHMEGDRVCHGFVLWVFRSMSAAFSRRLKL